MTPRAKRMLETDNLVERYHAKGMSISQMMEISGRDFYAISRSHKRLSLKPHDGRKWNYLKGPIKPAKPVLKHKYRENGQIIKVYNIGFAHGYLGEMFRCL